MLNQLNFISDLENDKEQQKTRLLILIFLGLTIIPSLIFWAITQLRQNPPQLGNFPGGKEIFQFQSSKNVYAILTPKLDKWAEENFTSLPGQWSIKISFLEEGFHWQRHSGQKIPAESLINFPVIVASYQQLTEESAVNSLILEWGMKDTSQRGNLTTVEDISLFLTKLYQGDILSESDKNMVFDDLNEISPEAFIPDAIPQGIRFVHQSQALDNYAATGGIIYFPENPYVLVIVGKETDGNLAQQKLPQIISDLYWIIADNL